MQILLIGNRGQLGWELQRTLAPLGELYGCDYPEFNLTDRTQRQALLKTLKPQIIINAAAYTNVDQAETERDLAMAVNGQAPGELAQEAANLGAALIHYSTDYVFDGTQSVPYHEADLPNPINVYGESKLAGEQAMQQVDGSQLILRTSWVYSLRRGSFVTKVLSWSRQNQTLRIVADQISNPTWCRMLAEVTAQVLVAAGKTPAAWIGERRGIYHLAGSGHASRLDWARAILKLDPQAEEQTATEILPAATREFPTPAVRPLYTALNCDRFTSTFGLRLPDWETSLHLAMEKG
jgi:dTDP-4-dehydrorhamnose reductase